MPLRRRKFCISRGFWFLVCATSLAWGMTAFAQQAARTSVPNGCGGKWSRYFVPDSVPIAQCDFRAACYDHDICYAKCENSLTGDCEYRRCLPGGDLHSKRVCFEDERLISLAVRAEERRKVCDNNFYNNLRRDNRGKWACSAFAVVYRDAVKTFGGTNFVGLDPFEGPPQSQVEYEGAIREFFAKASERDYQRLVEADAAGKPLVNFKRRLRYSEGRGLHNIDER